MMTMKNLSKPCGVRAGLPMLILIIALLCMTAAFAAADEAGVLPIDIEILRDPLDVLVLVNRENRLEKSYPDQNVGMYRLEKVKVSKIKGSGTHMLRPVANAALKELFDAALEEDVKLYIGSSHRKHRNQEVIYYNRVKRMGYDDGYSQQAGASEHQTGLAADVVSEEYFDVYETSFGQSREGIWLRENCARFGFIIRYPENKEDITGIRYEPWHIRYVGKEVAAYIMDNDLTLEEFECKRVMALGQYFGEVNTMAFIE